MNPPLRSITSFATLQIKILSYRLTPEIISASADPKLNTTDEQRRIGLMAITDKLHSLCDHSRSTVMFVAVVSSLPNKISPCHLTRLTNAYPMHELFS